MVSRRALGGVLLSVVGLAGCGGVARTAATGTPAERCTGPTTRPATLADRHPSGGGTTVSLGPLSLVVDPYRRAGGRVAAPKAVAVVSGRRAVTLAVDRSSRRRLSLLFAGASTGRPRFRVADGPAAVRFPACGRPATTFLGGLLVRGGGCVRLHATIDGTSRPVHRGSIGCRATPATRLARALMARGGPPAPTVADCRPSSPAERTAAPFGHTRRPLYACTLTVTGERAIYDVQVLGNGCFVAERRRPGRAVYGCARADLRQTRLTPPVATRRRRALARTPGPTS